MSPRIAVTGRIPSAGLEMLDEAGELVTWDSLDVPTVDEVHALVKGADAVLTLLTTKVDDAFLDAAGPQLKIVANVAVGYNNIDVRVRSPWCGVHQHAGCAHRRHRRHCDGTDPDDHPSARRGRTGDPQSEAVAVGMFYMLGSGIQATGSASSGWATSARHLHGAPRRSA